MKYILRHILSFGLVMTSSLAVGTMAAAQGVYFDDSDSGVADIKHRHEVYVNLTRTIISHMPELGYEYIFTPDMSTGARISVNAKADNNKINQLFQATPYFRWYLTADGSSERRMAKGFFAELSASFTAYKKLENTTIGYEVSGPGTYTVKEHKNNSSLTGLGLAVSAGWKYVSRSGWTCSLFSGLGTNFIGYDGIYHMGGITVGKRF